MKSKTNFVATNANKFKSGASAIPNEIKIITCGQRFELISNIEHDDVAMYHLIEAIYQLRNKQYEEFMDKSASEN